MEKITKLTEMREEALKRRRSLEEVVKDETRLIIDLANEIKRAHAELTGKRRVLFQNVREFDSKTTRSYEGPVPHTLQSSSIMHLSNGYQGYGRSYKIDSAQVRDCEAEFNQYLFAQMEKLFEESSLVRIGKPTGKELDDCELFVVLS